MSAEVRQLLADAASSVDGLTGHPYFVQTSNAGHVVVRLDRIEYPNPFGGVVFWDVVLMLPQDLVQAEKYLEKKVPLLREALDPHLVIKSIEPQRLDLPGVGIVPCVFVRGFREEE